MAFSTKSNILKLVILFHESTTKLNQCLGNGKLDTTNDPKIQIQKIIDTTVVIFKKMQIKQHNLSKTNQTDKNEKNKGTTS